jgi:hypothetical protein
VHGASKTSASNSPLPQSSPPSLLSSPSSSAGANSAQPSPVPGASSPGHHSMFHSAPRASTGGNAASTGAPSAPTASGANRDMHRRGSTLDKFMESVGHATVAFTAGLVDEVHGKE